MKKSSATLGLFIQDSHKDGYFHVKAYPVTIGLTAAEMRQIDNGEDRTDRDVNSDTVRNVGSGYGETQNGLRLDGVEVYSQGQDDTRYGPRSLYGWSVHYGSQYRVERTDAIGMAKTLTAIEKRMTAIATDFGRPLSFGQYLLHVSKAIGASRMVFKSRHDRSGSTSYRHMELTLTDLADGASRVDHMVRQWIEAGIVTPDTSAV